MAAWENAAIIEDARKSAAPPPGSVPTPARSSAQPAWMSAPAIEEPTKAPSKIIGAARSALEGLTLGFSDELGVGLAALAAKATGAEAPLSDIYKDMKTSYEQEQKQFKEESPGIALGSELAGGLATGLAGGLKAAATTAGKSGLRRLGTYAGTGAAYGGVSGAGFAEQGDTMEGATRGAIMGGATGAAIPAVASVATKLAKPALDRLMGKAGTVAKRQIEKDIKTAGMTMDEVETELQRMGPNATLADLSETLRSRAETVAQLPGAGREASKIFAERNEAAGGRISGAINNLFGGRVRLVDAVDDIVKRTEEEASPMFKQAYQRYQSLPAYRINLPNLATGATPTKEIVNPGLNKLMNSGMVRDAIERVSKRYESAGIGKNLTPENMGLEDWHEVRKVLDDVAYGKIKESVTGKPIGDTAVARNLRKRLTKELNDLTRDPETKKSVFEEANKIYADQAQALEAIDLGSKFWTKSPDLIRKELSDMSQTERDSYRLSALQKLYDKASDATAGGSVYSRLFNSPGKKDRIRAVLQDEDTFKQFEQLMKNEAAFSETFRATRMDSPTARRLLGAEEAGIDPGVAVDVGTGRLGSAALGLARKAVSGLTKPSEAQREELSRLLMRPGPEAQAALRGIRRRPIGFYEDPDTRARLGGTSAALLGEASGTL